MLMVAMTLLKFIGKDNYNKLGTSFTTLLMMAVYADQVKSSTPSHVQYLKWIDIFILNNFITNVKATVNLCLLIMFEEHEWDNFHDALGMATCYTQISFVFIINIALLVIGYTKGAKAYMYRYRYRYRYRHKSDAEKEATDTHTISFLLSLLHTHTHTQT